MLKYTII